MPTALHGEMRDSGLSFYDAAKGKRGAVESQWTREQFMVLLGWTRWNVFLRKSVFWSGCHDAGRHDDDGRKR